MPSKKWICIEAGLTDYQKAWSLQLEIVKARKAGKLPADVLLLLEHPPVFTLGRRGGIENLTVSRDFLEKSDIQVICIERGGNITFHAPGQLVGYPIVNLHTAKLSVSDYVENLEEMMIRTVADFGVNAERNSLNHGIWVQNNKLGSIGIAVRRGITFHGFALNVNLSLTPFEWINPCGLRGVGMTSIERELSREVSLKQICETAKKHIEDIFDVCLESKTLSELLKCFPKFCF